MASRQSDLSGDARVLAAIASLDLRARSSRQRDKKGESPGWLRRRERLRHSAGCRDRAVRATARSTAREALSRTTSGALARRSTMLSQSTVDDAVGTALTVRRRSSSSYRRIDRLRANTMRASRAIADVVFASVTHGIQTTRDDLVDRLRRRAELDETREDIVRRRSRSEARDDFGSMTNATGTCSDARSATFASERTAEAIRRDRSIGRSTSAGSIFHRHDRMAMARDAS